MSPSVMSAVSSPAQHWKFGRHPTGGGSGIGEVDVRDPFGGPRQRHVGMQDAPRLAMGENSLAGSRRHHRASADRSRRRDVSFVRLVQVGLDERRTRERGRGVGDEWSDLRPGTIRADEEIGAHGRSVGEGQLVPALAVGYGTGDLAAPVDGSVGERVEQDPAQISAKHLGSLARAVVGLVEQRRAVPAEHAHGLSALVDDLAEPLGEAGRL